VGSTRGTATWLWLPPVVSAGTAYTVYAVEASRGKVYAGDEPQLEGLFLAAPFVALCLFQVVCAVWTMTTETPRGRTVWLGLMTSGAVALAGLVVAAYLAGGYLSAERTVRIGAVVVALLLPLVPAWSAKGLTDVGARS
jgi:hypothetical protein